MAHEVEPGYVRSARYTFARPADGNAYAIGDAIANDTSGSLVVPMEFKLAKENGGMGYITGAQLLVDSATAFGAMRLHLFNRAPFATAASYQGDNAALALTYAAMRVGAADQKIDGDNLSPHSIPNKLPLIDFTTFQAHTTSAISIGQCDQTEPMFVCGPGTKIIYGLLEARAVFTPANAGNFVVMLTARGIA